jgi:hypothetical protein
MVDSAGRRRTEYTRETQAMTLDTLLDMLAQASKNPSFTGKPKMMIGWVDEDGQLNMTPLYVVMADDANVVLMTRHEYYAWDYRTEIPPDKLRINYCGEWVDLPPDDRN